MSRKFTPGTIGIGIEFHRFVQPIGKQYTFGHGPSEPEVTSADDRIKQLEMQVEILKKYREMERRWSLK